MTPEPIAVTEANLQIASTTKGDLEAADQGVLVRRGSEAYAGSKDPMEMDAVSAADNNEDSREGGNEHGFVDAEAEASNAAHSDDESNSK
uniref:Uncharacterized protein n=1 Tax=Moniliophthora roreri TaxID=221103 RepID=A0A0W0G7Y9_MONRR